jgi:hypothetical protein
MSLANKTFKNLVSGQDITIIDQLGDFAILTNGGKVNVTDLMDSNKYIESINPNTFLSSHYDSFKDLAEKIVNTPVNKDVIEVTPVNNNYNVSNESAVIISSLEDEKEELARKYGFPSNSVTDTVNKQNEAFDRILNPIKEEPIRKEYNQPQSQSNEIKQNMEDPIYHIFKNTKKSVEFEFTIKVDGKIPRLDFIEMMEDSYETSIIEFLSKEFTNKILQNPSLLEDQIKSKIKEMVYGKNETKVVDKIVDEKLTDSIKEEPIKETSKRRTRKNLKVDEIN